MASVLAQPPAVQPWAQPVPPPLADGQQARHHLFRRAVREGAGADAVEERGRDETVREERRRAGESSRPANRPANGNTPPGAVVAFPGFGGFSPQFLTQLIAQEWLPPLETPDVRGDGARAYGETARRIHPEIIFGPVAPFSASV